MRTTLVAASLPFILLVVLAAPASAAGSVDLGPAVTFVKKTVDDATDVQVGDVDGDGWDEAGASAGWGPVCGCACPVVGAGVGLEAAGWTAQAEAATVILPFCGFAVSGAVDPADPDPLAPVVVDPDLWCWFYGDPLGMDGDCLPDLDFIATQS